MLIGDVVADRFVIQREIGSGGMGTVYVATDQVAGGNVALKVLNSVFEGAIERFRQEARVLAELSHPRIVRYVAQGETETRQPFIAMELLEGEDLGQRLSQRGLTLEECLQLFQRAGEALAFAHERGIVHRDVKPSNLFLVGGSADSVKVLDFGIARFGEPTEALTQTGTLLGTMGYMAPEQAMGSRDVDARADVFALGCVLFECLTGRPAFEGKHAVAILAKVLTEEAPKVSDLRPGIGDALDALVARMLCKDRQGRPDNCRAALAALDEIGSSPVGSSRPLAMRSYEGLTLAEQKFASVILAEPVGADLADTSTEDRSSDAIVRAEAIARRYSADFAPLQGHRLLFVLSGGGEATDQAVRAVSCALAVFREFPALRVSLATGRTETRGRLAVGPAIDRAAALLHASHAPAARHDGVLVDDATVVMAGSRFEVRQTGEFRLLVGESGEIESPRNLMGKPTETVGREKELALLEAILRESMDDKEPRAVLVTAPPGIGKSRLASEFLVRVRALRGVRVLLARADGVAAGSSLALAQKLIRYGTGLRESDPAPVQQARLRKYLSTRVDEPTAERLAEFLGELVGAPTDRPPSAALRTARNDPTLMREHKRRAFETWTANATKDQCVLVVLEDLHFADQATITYLDDALRQLSDRSLMVLSLGRPEVHEKFPTLWEGMGTDPGPQEIRLGGLTRRAAERLVRTALGDRVTAATVSKIVERADGNAFYLEELIRQVAQGVEHFPETVLAMAEARLTALDAEARRVLRAGSIYGETFWANGVAALLGGTVDAPRWLEALADQELLQRSPQSRFSGERQYVFRHGLLREAAYAMLTDEDRRMGHRLAAAWLERAGETDPLVMAEHLDCAGDTERVAPWLVAAAEAAYDGGNANAARALAIRGANYAGGEMLGVLRAVEAAAARVQLDVEGELVAVRQALELLRPGTLHWFTALSGLAYRATTTGDRAAARQVAQALVELPPVSDAHAMHASAARTLILAMMLSGRPKVASQFLDQIEAVAKLHPDHDLQFSGWLNLARATVYLYDAGGSPGDALRVAHAAALCFEEAGNSLGYSWAAFWEGLCLFNLGGWSRAVERLEVATSYASASANRFILAYSELVLALVRPFLGQTEQAAVELRSLGERREVDIAGHAVAALGDLALMRGDFAEAESQAKRALDLSQGALSVELHAESSLARAVLGSGSPEEALAYAEKVIAAPSGNLSLYLSDAYRTRAEAFHAMGKLAEAQDSIRNARARVLRIAATIDDDELRESFLSRVGPCAETLALATRWLPDEELAS
jgi:tetratricopeptide (TPR) repeat protein